MNDWQIYEEIASKRWSKRRHRREDAKSFGSRWLYDYRKNTHLPCAIEGSKGLQIEAVVRGNKIIWHDTLVKGRYID